LSKDHPQAMHRKICGGGARVRSQGAGFQGEAAMERAELQRYLDNLLKSGASGIIAQTGCRWKDVLRSVASCAG
jgi:hypothetical protein